MADRHFRCSCEAPLICDKCLSGSCLSHGSERGHGGDYGSIPYSINLESWKPFSPSALTASVVEDIVGTMVNSEESLLITGYSGQDHDAVKALVGLADTVKGLRVLSTRGSDMCFPLNFSTWLRTR